MTDYGDRRKEPRKIVMSFTPVYNLEKGILLGYLRDLTKGGAQVNGEKKVEVNTQIFLSIELPKNLPDVTSKNLSVAARVVRCDAVQDSPNSYETGFEFSNLNEEQLEIIEKLLDQYHFRHQML